MRKLLFLTLAATIGFSCSEDECGPVGTTDDNVDEIKITALIADVQPLLKTTYSGSTASWANNDALGLFCPQSKLNPAVNVKFTFNSSTWTPETALYWSDGTTKHRFMAYAPYATGNSDSAAVKLPALTGQVGTVIDPSKDFLISNKFPDNGMLRTASVPLTFTHALSLIEFQVKSDVGIVSGATLKNYSLTAATGEKLFTSDANSTTINLGTAVITKGTTVNTLTVTPSTAPTLSTTATSLYTLLLPGTYTAMNLGIVITEGSTDVTVPVTAVGTLTFDPGKKYTYTVTISRTAITISTPTISDWTTVNGSEIKPGI